MRVPGDNPEVMLARIQELRVENVLLRACVSPMALDALKALREVTGSRNDENPWLGVTAAVALLQNRVCPQCGADLQESR